MGPHEITVMRDFQILSSVGSWSVDRRAHIQAFTFSSQDHGRLSIDGGVRYVYVYLRVYVYVCINSVIWKKVRMRQNCWDWKDGERTVRRAKSGSYNFWWKLVVILTRKSFVTLSFLRRKDKSNHLVADSLRQFRRTQHNITHTTRACLRVCASESSSHSIGVRLSDADWRIASFGVACLLYRISERFDLLDLDKTIRKTRGVESSTSPQPTSRPGQSPTSWMTRFTLCTEMHFPSCCRSALCACNNHCVSPSYGSRLRLLGHVLRHMRSSFRPMEGPCLGVLLRKWSGPASERGAWHPLRCCYMVLRLRAWIGKSPSILLPLLQNIVETKISSWGSALVEATHAVLVSFAGW